MEERMAVVNLLVTLVMVAPPAVEAAFVAAVWEEELGAEAFVGMVKQAGQLNPFIQFHK